MSSPGGQKKGMVILTSEPDSGSFIAMKAFDQFAFRGACRHGTKSTRPAVWRRAAAVIAAGAVCASVGCVRVKVDPIHVTMDVNVKVDKALDTFFDDLDAKAATSNAPAFKPAEKGALP